MRPEKAHEAIAFFEELLKEGIINQQDFEEKKNDILNLVEKTNNKDNSSDNSETHGSYKESSALGKVHSTTEFYGPPSVLHRAGSVGTMEAKRLSKEAPSTPVHHSSIGSNSDTGPNDLGKMEVLRKLSTSAASTHDLTIDLQRFVNLDKEFDNEDKMLDFIKYLMEKDQLPPMVNYIIKQEIDVNKNGLLREESLGASLLRNYWFNYEGKTYLKAIVGPLVKEVHGLKKPLEIDPNKASGPIAEKNLQKLLSITKSFLTILCRSHTLFPVTFRMVLKNFYGLLTESEGAMKAHLGLGYSEDALRLFGSFLLLRFICPAIVSPKRYGLIKGEVTVLTQRALVLISKILQSIASQVEFEGEKEPYMIPANEFVKDNMPPLMAFFQRLADGDDISLIKVTSINSPQVEKKKDNRKDKNVMVSVANVLYQKVQNL